MTDGPVVGPGDRRCPVSLALCAGAYWLGRGCGHRVRSGGSRVHSLPSSLRFPPATGSLCRRSTGTRPVHSPFFVMSREDGRPRRGRQALGWTPAFGSMGSKPTHSRTGRFGYRGKRGSVVERSQSRKIEPRADRITRECRHAPHRPGGGPVTGTSRFGGEGGIRTHEVFRLSAFQERRHQPLGHLSAVRISATRAAAGQPAGSMTSRPRYGRSTSGTVTEPSGRWYVSRIAATIRASASPEPLSVWTSSGLAPASGR